MSPARLAYKKHTTAKLHWAIRFRAGEFRKTVYLLIVSRHKQLALLFVQNLAVIPGWQRANPMTAPSPLGIDLKVDIFSLWIYRVDGKLSCRTCLKFWAEKCMASGNIARYFATTTFKGYQIDMRQNITTATA